MSLRDPLDQAFRDGYAKCRNGVSADHCPYALDPGSLDLILCHPAIRRAWMKGWHNAKVAKLQNTPHHRFGA